MNEAREISRNKVAEMLAELERRRRADPLKYAKEHDKQKEATKSMKQIRALFWGNRVGKTEWGAQEVARYATAKHPFREIKPPFEIWCGCPSFDAQESTTQPKILRYLPPAEIASTEKLRGDILRSITMRNGVKIYFKSYEQSREKWQGAGTRLIWFDEEPPHDIWEEGITRVEAGQPLDVILTMTPIKGMTWVYEEIYQNTRDPDLFVSTAGWIDNPWLTSEQIVKMSRRYSPEVLQVRRDGKFVKRVGLVCDWWMRDKHLKHYEALDKTWTYYEVMDGGWNDPLAWLLIGVDGDNNVNVVDGFRRKHLITPEVAILRNQKTAGLTLTHGWIDSADSRLRNDLEKERIYLTPVEKTAKNSETFDQTLAEKLAEYGRVQAGTGLPRLFISDNLIEISEKTGNEENFLMQEIENLVWLEQKSRAGEEIKPKWDDHRRFGHHFDAIRALAYFLISYMKPMKYEPVQQEEYFDEDGFY